MGLPDSRLPTRPQGLHAPLWEAMDRRPRLRVGPALRAEVPPDPGVYAWYHDAEACYVGKGDSLKHRVWTKHLGQSRSLGASAFRRNVAEHLGFGSPADIKSRRIRLTDEQRAAVRLWIEECEVAWIVCDTFTDAKQLEDDLKDEWLPPLTKR